MHVHALEQSGTFVVAWPRIRQCLLCSGKERASALAKIHAHKLTHSHANIPMDSQGWKGAEQESGPCRHSESSQSEAALRPSTTRHREHIPSPRVILPSHCYHTKHTDLHIRSVGTGLTATNTNHCCLQSTCSLHVHIHSKHILHFTSVISTSSTLVPLKILCRDCFLLFSKGQDMERQSTLWPLCLLCLPLPRELSLFPLLCSTCLPAVCP